MIALTGRCREQRAAAASTSMVKSLADVDETPASAPLRTIASSGRREGERHGQHRVAGADAERLQRELERVGAVADADARARAPR